MNAQTYGYHRQYYLDRVGSTVNSLHFWNAEDRLSADYEWWLQGFKRGKGGSGIRSYNDGEIKKIRGQLRLQPKGDGAGTSYSSLVSRPPVRKGSAVVKTAIF